ncbi:MAG: caspase family protein [Bacteroidetes bacterium]|nr:caspase family protein [Bacteroidota bacterium]MBP6314523.1 caspase family protein [Chitinophagaceae bacterium]
MRNKHLIVAPLCLLYSISLQAQAVFQFQFKQKIAGIPTQTYALFFQNEDGSGFLRERYTDPKTNETMLLGMSLDEEYITKENGKVDTTQLYIKTIEPEIFLGDPNTEKPSHIFLFTANVATGELAPSSMMKLDELGNKVKDAEANFKASFVSAEQMTEALFQNYFQEGDEFLTNFFRSNSKDISAAEKKMTIHMLVVANTLEDKIGSSCAMDTLKITQLFRRIALYLGCTIKVSTVAGKQYGKKSVQDALAKLKPAPNDIVVFYYSGHGFRKEEDPERYPYIDLRANHSQHYLKEAMKMATIDSIIRKKGARVNIVLSDCCNNLVESTNAVGVAPLKMKSNPLVLNMNNIRALFLSGSVSILATAADRTQKATSNNQYGGFFTNFFKNSLELNCSQTQAGITWFKVLEEAKTNTAFRASRTYCDTPKIVSNICNQSPSYRVIK